MSKVRPDDHQWTDEELRALNVPQAHHFRMFGCGDPTCGPHFLAFDADNMPIVEMVVGRRVVPSLVKELRENFT